MAFVVVGWIVVNTGKDAKGLTKREQKISGGVFETRGGADAYCELAKKNGYPGAAVREVMKHDNIN